MVAQKNSVWMALSGAIGFIFFLVANFTNLFQGSSFVAGGTQILVNVFVFLVWKKAFQTSSGLKKFIAFWGIVVPVIMATITIWRVLLPVLF